jgi:hypothetical protein
MDQLPFTFTARVSRVYLHKTCGTETDVDKEPLTLIASPYDRVLATRCAKCGIVPFSSVSWTDTGENLDAYRKRLRKGFKDVLIPAWVCAVLGMLVGAGVVLGALIGDMPNFGEFIAFLASAIAIGFFAGLFGVYWSRDRQFDNYCIKNKLLPMHID